MQSRTSSQAHVIKRSRSRSRRRPEQQQQQQQQAQRSGDGRRTPTHHESIFNESAYSHFTEESHTPKGRSRTKRSSSQGNMPLEGKINEHGRCARHPAIELCVRDSVTSEWRVLLQDCPLCSLDDSGLNVLRGDMAGKPSEGGGCSQATPTPSTKTNRTNTTEEESVKSWTVSDASTSEGEGSVVGRVGPLPDAEPLFRPQPPPHPRGLLGKPAPGSYPAPLPQENSKFDQGNNQVMSQFFEQNNLETSHPVQSLKELGRKLVLESEQQPRCPPPPPKRPPQKGHRNSNFQMIKESLRQSDSRASNYSSASRRQGNLRPPPRQREQASAAGGGHEESNENILGEASDIIAKMASRTNEGEAAMGSNRGARRQQQQQRQQKQKELMNLRMREGHADTTEEDPIAARVAAAEKRARAQRRREKAERKAARLRARDSLLRKSEGDGETFTMPMKDGSTHRGKTERGRASDARNTVDILQAAADIRARARRSTSRSRERVREASLFCGEAPEGDYKNDEDFDNKSMSSGKRSILNPHGLEEPPRPVTVERRSQSRERLRGRSGGPVEAGYGARSRTSREVAGPMAAPELATARGLLARRREQRQQILRRQQDAQLRKDQRLAEAGGGGGLDDADEYASHLSLKEQVLGAWSGDTRGLPDESSIAARSAATRRSGRNEPRGRSRSVVRDGISRIRSSSLFRRKGGRGRSGSDEGGGNAHTAELQTEDGRSGHGSIDSSRRSTSSFRRILSRGKPRSRSRGRRFGRGGEPNRGSHQSDSEDLDSDFDGRSTGAKSKHSSASFGVFKRSLSRGRTRPKPGKGGVAGMGMVRSLSRGNFRNDNHDDINVGEQISQYGQSTYSWEAMRTQGKPGMIRGLNGDHLLDL